VPTEAARRHIATNYQRHLDRALASLDRSHARIRFVVSGFDEDDEEA
jgi:hypothetical protein